MRQAKTRSQRLVGRYGWFSLLLLLLVHSSGRPGVAQSNWTHVGGDANGTRYSPLKQIDRSNVKDLQPAWTFHTRQPELRLDPHTYPSIQCTPIVIDGMMYLTSADTQLIAVDAATGREIWRFNPQRTKHPYLSNRGVAYWSDGRPNGTRRILFAIPDGRLYSLDARTGKPDVAFGRQGVVELREGIERDLSQLVYGASAAPAIFENLVIIGFSVDEGYVSAPGDIRAFDVRTGKEVWRFHTVPRPGEPNHETWPNDSWKNRGGANAWGGVRVDLKNGLVFAGLGSATHDFYGGDRPGDNLYANSVVALNARTGKLIWHFQTVHHDLWDYDIPAPPVLVEVTHRGRRIEAVAQATKTGYLYLFERLTGKPLFEIVERPVPESDVPGEKTARTQPIPVRPAPFARQGFTDADITNISPESTQYIKEKLKSMRYGAPWLPPSLQGTIQMPGLHGGSTWSSAFFEPRTGWLFLNVNDMPWTVALQPDRPSKGLYAGARIEIFRDQFGFPGVKPPWGKLVAIDLNTGDTKWQVPLGDWPGARERGLHHTGTENFGGGIVTAGGLIFIASTMDEMFRAFDKDTGELLWEYKLPAAGYAAPATYEVAGRQYVVIAAGGGGKPRTKMSDTYVAFALPQKSGGATR